MTKLWLVFTDENGEEKRVEVDRLPFVIGRQSGTDLPIPDGRLSREHVRIEQKENGFVVSDTGSTNGTLLNGEDLLDSVPLRNGDIIDAGGAIKMTAIFEEAAPSGEDRNAAAPDMPGPDLPAAQAPRPPIAAPPADLSSPAGASGGGIPTALPFIAPLLGLLVLGTVLLGVVLLGGSGSRADASNSDETGYSADDDGRSGGDDDRPTPKPARSATPSVSGTESTDAPHPTSPPSSGGSDSLPGSDDSGTAAVERNGAAFIRQIALNDPKAFLTGEQAARVNLKIKQFGRSSVLADNLGSARKNANAIKTLAQQKNLTPQFLAVAAMTKLGNSRGDVLQAAQSVVETYEQLRIQIGNENFDDALLMVAGYDQGAAGDAMKMRNMLQDLATKSNEGARTIRSIWFLEKTGKITPAEFERALNFLAIGTIVQNPKEFGVNAEALRM